MPELPRLVVELSPLFYALCKWYAVQAGDGARLAVGTAVAAIMAGLFHGHDGKLDNDQGAPGNMAVNNQTDERR